MQVLAGTTNQSINLRIVDSTDGTPETGVVYNTSGIDLWYRREGAAKVSITEATLAALTTAHTDGGFLTISDGWYRLDVPDLAFASGASGVQIGGTVTGMVVMAPYVELTTSVAQTGDNYARLGAPAGASIAADLLVIDNFVDGLESTIGVAGAGLTDLGAMSTAMIAQVNAACDTALTDYDGLVPADLPTNFGSMVISGAGAVDSLQQGILNALFTETTAGRIGANFDTFFENADAATAQTVDDVGAGASSPLTAQETRDAMKLAPTGGAPAAGSVDEHLDDILLDTETTIPALIAALNDFNPAVDTVALVTLVSTCSANTDMRGTDSALLAASVPANFASMTISVGGDVTADTVTDKTGYSISGTITTLDGLNNLSAAQVNAEAVDALATDTYAEPSGVPAATSSLKDKIGFLFANARNKSTQTATTRLLRNDADTGTIATESVSDDGTTYIKGEAV